MIIFECSHLKVCFSQFLSILSVLIVITCLVFLHTFVVNKLVYYNSLGYFSTVRLCGVDYLLVVFV